VEDGQILDLLRILLASGLVLSGLLIYIMRRGDAETSWYRRYLEEYPGLRSDFEAWRRHRRRQESVESGRCPDHKVYLDPAGLCSRCHGRPQA